MKVVFYVWLFLQLCMNPKIWWHCICFHVLALSTYHWYECCDENRKASKFSWWVWNCIYLVLEGTLKGFSWVVKWISIPPPYLRVLSCLHPQHHLYYQQAQFSVLPSTVAVSPYLFISFMCGIELFEYLLWWNSCLSFCPFKNKSWAIFFLLSSLFLVWFLFLKYNWCIMLCSCHSIAKWFSYICIFLSDSFPL